jgi:hypothetical protein
MTPLLKFRSDDMSLASRLLPDTLLHTAQVVKIELCRMLIKLLFNFGTPSDWFKLGESFQSCIQWPTTFVMDAAPWLHDLVAMHRSLFKAANTANEVATHLRTSILALFHMS